MARKKAIRINFYRFRAKIITGFTTGYFNCMQSFFKRLVWDHRSWVRPLNEFSQRVAIVSMP
jgi:hypothetical protein